MITVAISAHRGGAEHASPATYGAYKCALSSGAEYAEFDIRKTRDNVLVVYHDEHCGQDGPLVASVGYSEMCDRVDYVVPRVDEVMSLLAGNLIGHLDLKETGYEDEVISLALDTFGPGNFVATTLEDESVARIKRSFPDVRAALSLGRDLDGQSARTRLATRYSELFPIRRIRACGADWVALNYKVAIRGALQRCADQGVGAMVWTVDEDPLIDRFLADPRVNVLITNRPERAVARRAARSDNSWARRAQGDGLAAPGSPGCPPDGTAGAAERS